MCPLTAKYLLLSKIFKIFTFPCWCQLSLLPPLYWIRVFDVAHFIKCSCKLHAIKNFLEVLLWVGWSIASPWWPHWIIIILWLKHQQIFHYEQLPFTITSKPSMDSCCLTVVTATVTPLSIVIISLVIR